jgi:hypothetical protein
VVQSQVALYNLALDAVGMDYVINAVDEETIGAEKCNLWYEPTRQALLRSAHWNSSKRFARLTIEAERDDAEDWVTTDPMPGWAYSYSLPADYLYARHLADFQPFDIALDNDKLTLVSNWGSDTASERPILCYTFDQTDITKWEPDLYIAMAHALAANICMGITAKLARKMRLQETVQGLIAEARATAANEYHQLWRFRPSVLAARGYGVQESTQYLYPYGVMFSSTGAPLT